MSSSRQNLPGRQSAMGSRRSPAEFPFPSRRGASGANRVTPRVPRVPAIALLRSSGCDQASCGSAPTQSSSWSGGSPGSSRDLHLENLPPALWQTEEEATESEVEVDPELLQWTDGLPVRTPRLLRGVDPPNQQTSAVLAPPTWDWASKRQATVLPRNGTCEWSSLSEDCSESNCTSGCDIGLRTESANSTVDSFLSACVPGYTEPDVLKVQPQGPRRRLETLATQGSALLRITQEELDSISQVTFKCEQYFGASTQNGGGCASASCRRVVVLSLCRRRKRKKEGERKKWREGR